MKAIWRALAIVTLLLGMVCFPQTVFQAAGQALQVWWQAVIPSLLPFFITAELFLQSGMAKAFSYWLTPLMRPLFDLPGAAALPLVMGFVSGSPTGANITAELRRQNLCTREEGNRLVAFTNNAGPLFILAATAVGIFQNPALGIWLFLAHYPLNLLYGIILGLISRRREARPTAAKQKHNLQQGLQALQESAGLSIGLILGKSVRKALLTIGSIGGFMLFFGAMAGLLQELGVLAFLGNILSFLLQPLGFSQALAIPLGKGFLEMTIGVSALAECAAPLLARLQAASLILAWQGLSIQAQVAAMLSGTDLSSKLYLFGRLLHGIAAAAIMLCFSPYLPALSLSSPLPLSQPSSLLLCLIAWGIFLLLVMLGYLWQKKRRLA